MDPNQPVVSSWVSPSVHHYPQFQPTAEGINLVHVYSHSQLREMITCICNRIPCPSGVMRMTGEHSSDVIARGRQTDLVQGNTAQPSDQRHSKCHNRYKSIRSMVPHAATVNPSRSGEPRTRSMVQMRGPDGKITQQFAAAQLRCIFGAAFHPGVEASRNNAMLMAAKNGNPPLIELLLALKDSIEIRDESGHTPLMLAILSRSHAAIDLLLDAGADLNARDKFDNTPIMHAAKMDDVRHIYALRRAWADVDARDKWGNTALIFAIEKNNLLAVQSLLDPDIEGSVAANPAVTDLYGVAPLFVAINARVPAFNDNRVEEVRKNSTIIAALFGAGADVNARDNKGNTLQIYAVMMRDAELVTMLRDAGANLELKNIDGKSAMTYALEIGLPWLCNILQNRK